MCVSPHVWTFRPIGDSPIDVAPHGREVDVLAHVHWGETSMGELPMGRNVSAGRNVYGSKRPRGNCPWGEKSWHRFETVRVFFGVPLIIWPPCGIGQAIIFSSCGFYLLLLCFFLAWSQRPHAGYLPYFDTWCGLSANLECMPEMCCTRLAENTGRKNLSLIHIWRCRRSTLCRSRWSPYH